MEKFLVMSLLCTTGIFIAFLGTMILARAVYDIVVVALRAWRWMAGRKRPTGRSY